MAFQGVYLLSAWSSRESEPPPRNMVERNGRKRKRVIAEKERPPVQPTRRGAEPSFRAGFKVARLRWQPLNGGGGRLGALCCGRRPPFAQR